MAYRVLVPLTLTEPMQITLPYVCQNCLAAQCFMLMSHVAHCHLLTYLCDALFCKSVCAAILRCFAHDLAFLVDFIH